MIILVKKREKWKYYSNDEKREMEILNDYSNEKREMEIKNDYSSEKKREMEILF